MFKGEFDFCGNVEPAPDLRLGQLGRRNFLFQFGRGAGSLALPSLLSQDGWSKVTGRAEDPLTAKPPHLRPKAKS